MVWSDEWNTCVVTGDRMELPSAKTMSYRPVNRPSVVIEPTDYHMLR